MSAGPLTISAPAGALRPTKQYRDDSQNGDDEAGEDEPPPVSHSLFGSAEALRS